MGVGGWGGLGVAFLVFSGGFAGEKRREKKEKTIRRPVVKPPNIKDT